MKLRGRVKPWPEAPSSPRLVPEHGRYLGPLCATPWPVSRFRLKHWHFLSLWAGPHFVGLGLVQLGYVAQLFAYCVDTRSGERSAYEALSPLGAALRMARTPVRGVSRWRSRAARVAIRARDGFHFSVDLPLGGRRLEGNVHVPWGAGLSLVHPLAEGQTAYTYKVADVPVDGGLHLGGVPLSLGEARACMDWTYSHALRDTRWRWASATGSARGGRRLGLNLSSDVYDVAGVSQENVLWVDGEPRQLGAMQLSVPGRPSEEPWTIEGPSTQLTFHPQSTRQDAQDFGVVASRFVQAAGHFEGELRGMEVDRMYGLMEDHRARW